MSDTRDDDRMPIVKYTVPFSYVSNKALLAAACDARMEPTEIIQRAVIEHLMQTKFLVGEEAERIRLFWRLVDYAVLKAQEICRRGDFKASITLDAIHLCLKDVWWVDGYRTYIGDDIYKNGISAKGPINREIGFRVRVGIGGEVKKDATGKTMMVKVLGEIIQSYTPMADYNRLSFEKMKAA